MNDTPHTRRHPRLPYHTAVWIGQDSIYRRAPGEVIDISLGGACLRLEAIPITTGDIVDLRFALPDDDRVIACSVLVKNTDESGALGVEFLTISNAHRHRLERFVDALLVA